MKINLEERVLLSLFKEAFPVEIHYMNVKWEVRSQGGRAGTFKGHVLDGLKIPVTCGLLCLLW